MAVFKIFVSIFVLFFGAYALHAARKEVKVFKSNQVKMTKLKRELTDEDYAFMQMAINDGKSGRDYDQSNFFGSIIVKNGKIVGTGSNQSHSPTDPTAHAEMEAVKNACNYLGTSSLEGCVVYTSSRPCPMCLSLCYLTKVDKIVYLMSSDAIGRTDVQLLNQRVYRSLIKNPGERPIPEVGLPREDFE